MQPLHKIFVTFPSFRGKIPIQPEATKTNRRNLEILEGMQISYKWLKNLQPTTSILFLALVELIFPYAFIQLPHQNLNITVLDFILNKKPQETNKKPPQPQVSNLKHPNIKTTNIPRKTWYNSSDPRALQYSLFCSICTVKELSPQSLTH